MTIEIVGLELHGYHGALPEERVAGQRFLFDVEAETADPDAGASDVLAAAVDYREIVRVVRTVSDGRAFHLLEALATAVADTLLSELPLARVRVRVRKPEVELGAPVTHAAVIVERVAAR